MAISLDLSQKSELRLLAALVREVARAAEGAPLFLAGAYARDVLLLYGHGIDTGRQTADVDLAIAIESWQRYETLRAALIARGFTPIPPTLHKLRYQRSVDATEVQVATLAALTFLKLVAWSERRLTQPGKDAHDLSLILRHYLEAGNSDRLDTEAEELLDAADFDYEAAGAWLLGKDVAGCLDAEGREQIAAMLAEESDPQGALRLAGDLRMDAERALRLIGALNEGFRQAAS